MRLKIYFPQKNFSQPLGAQSLRIRQGLRGVSLGPLAVPRQEELAGPPLPPASLPQVLLESSLPRRQAGAIRASRLEKFFLTGENLIPRSHQGRKGSYNSCDLEVGKTRPDSLTVGPGGAPPRDRVELSRRGPRRGNKFSPLTYFLPLFMFQVNVYAAVTVKGRVVFEGQAPAVEKVEVKSDIPTCGSAKEIRKIVLGKDQGVANAVVKIIGAKGTLEPKKGKLDQVNCEFIPHVQVLPVGSTLILTSSDPVLHNSHGFYEDGSTAFNIAVPIMGMEVSQKLNRAGIIKLRCDAGHTWMSAYVVVTDEPFYAPTDANGNFEIEGLPSGNYQIEIWHEWLGLHREPIEIKGEAEPLTITLRKS